MATAQERSMLTLVRHQPSGEAYVIRQSIAGHCEEITGPYYTPDYRNGDDWNRAKLSDHHATWVMNDSSCSDSHAAWADGEQWLNIAELE